MRQLLIRAVALLRRPAVLVTSLVLACGGVGLVFVPLFGVPGFELGEALAIALGLFGGIPAIASAFQERHLIQGRDPRPRGSLRVGNPMGATAIAVGAALLIDLAVLLPPFFTALFRSLWTTQCNPLSHVGFFPWLTVFSALLACAVGVFCGLAARSGWSAGLLYLLIVLGTLVATVWPIYFGPQVFAFNAFLGYFPGPLYDEALVLTPTLYWFRLHTLLIAAAVWLFTAFCLDMKEGRVLRPHFRPASATLLGLVVFGAVAISEQGPALGLRMSYDFLDQKLGGLRESEHFHIHYFRGKPREQLERLERDLEFRHAQLEAFLGGGPTEKIDVYVYRSAELKKQLVGAAGTQFAKPWQLSLHINDAPFPHPVIKHELLHVMASPFGTGPFHIAARLGIFPRMAIVEGLAVAGDNAVSDLTLHQKAAAMRHQKLAPDVRSLFSPRGFYSASPSRAYVIAGSFLRYLADTRGTEKMRKLYGLGDFQLAYGQSLDALAREWERFVDAVPIDPRAEAEAWRRFHQPSLFGRACAREVATLEIQAAEFLSSDPEKALELYQRCAKLQPGEPEFKLGQARALSRLERGPQAEHLLAGFASSLKDQPSVEAKVAMLRGDIAWENDLRELAKRQYQRVLSLKPDPPDDRAAWVKLAAVGSPVLEDPVRAWFSPGDEEVKLFLARSAADRDPTSPWPRYLIGRRLTQSTAPALGLPYLSAALGGQLPDSLHREALRLQLKAQYLVGDCAEVQHLVGTHPDYGAAFATWAQEWAERCDFETRIYKGPLVPPGPFR